jgi:hypothetical protein
MVREGMTADDDHPFVLERPDLWDGTPPPPDLQTPGRAAMRERPEVERATRAPGERRGGGRRG